MNRGLRVAATVGVVLLLAACARQVPEGVAHTAETPGFLLTGVSLFVLRYRDRNAERPFRVPLYPVTPLLFCVVCAYMLWSSINHAGRYSWVGLLVLAAGVPLLLAARPRATMAERRRELPVEPVEPAVQQQT